jgi:hypothetical protein
LGVGLGEEIRSVNSKFLPLKGCVEVTVVEDGGIGLNYGLVSYYTSNILKSFLKTNKHK